MRWKRVLLAAAVGISTVAAGSAAQAKDSAPSYRMSVSVEPVPGTGTTAGTSGDLVTRRGQGESEEQLRGRLNRPVMPLSEALAEQQRNLQVHHYYPNVTGAPGGIGTATFTGEDWITPAACRLMYADGKFKYPWHYQNHYSACQVRTLQLHHKACQGVPQKCEEIGQTNVRATIIGRGFHTLRAVDWDVYLDNWQVVRGTELSAKLLTVNVPCVWYDDGSQCTSKPNGGNGWTKSLAEWRISEHYVQSTDTTTMTPSTGNPEEKRGYFQFAPTFSSPDQGDFVQSKFTVARCDNAPYITGAQCIFTGTAGIFHLDYNQASYKGSVEFIYQAMHHLDQLKKPWSVGLYVPGGYYKQPTGYYEPLTRNYYNNSDDRTKVQAECKRLYGENYTVGPNGENMDCDEYPFNATYQGPKNYDVSGTGATWAVKPVVASQNRSAGWYFVEFMKDDAILDKDPFYLAIDNAPPS